MSSFFFLNPLLFLFFLFFLFFSFLFFDLFFDAHTPVKGERYVD